MNNTFVVLAIAAAAAFSASPLNAAELSGALKPLAFMLGKWEGGGDVADTGGKAVGLSTMTAEANGGVILRNDHNQLYDKAGKPSGAFDQVMMIYPDVGGVRAEYSDGQHLIHYGAATVVDGRSVDFASVAPPGAPVFHLRYEMLTPDRLKISFSMVEPGQTRFQPIAIGEMHRAK